MRNKRFFFVLAGSTAIWIARGCFREPLSVQRAGLHKESDRVAVAKVAIPLAQRSFPSR